MGWVGWTRGRRSFSFPFEPEEAWEWDATKGVQAECMCHDTALPGVT